MPRTTPTARDLPLPPTAIRPTDLPRGLRPVLLLDAVGCAVLAAVAVAFAGQLADGFHLAATGPVVLAGALFAVAAGVNGAAATGRPWPLLVATDLDVVFALWMALVLASGRGEPWARGLAAAGLVVSLAFGARKAVGWWWQRG